jgi:hypothetical protein
MTTLLLTTHPELGHHRLTITPTATVESVTRTDSNGTYEVRTMTGVLPHLAADGVLLLDDYEAAQGPATYTVTTADESLGDTIVMALTGPWLGTPEAPQFSTQVGAVMTYGAGTDTLSTVHEPEGRYDPIVIVRGASSRRGTMTVEGGSYAETLNLLRLCQRGQAMLLRQLDHPGMDMYFVPMHADIVTVMAAGRASSFELSVQYIEVARPKGFLSGALGWTWAALAASGMSWGDVFNTYASWGDLRTDVRKP